MKSSPTKSKQNGAFSSPSSISSAPVFLSAKKPWYKTLPAPFSYVYLFLQRVIGYGLLTLITFSGLFHFAWGFLLLPLRFIAPTIFRKACTFCLYYTVPGFLCVPFSWCNNKLHCNGLGRIKQYKGRDLLILANHSARVDWVLGLYIAACYGERVTFVTEAFILFLPFIGWFRYFIEDMFVFRSFKRDKDRLEKNIESFHKSGVTRWVFLSPEGHIADFNPSDQQYIENCENFCKERGLEPFTMVLTPRYKGMQCFNKIMTTGDSKKQACNLSVAMTYVQDGEILVKPLRSKERVVPDLWSLAKGGLECFVHFHSLEMSNDPLVMREQLMQDAAMKDKLLRHFYEHGRYPDAHPILPADKTPELWRPMIDEDFPRDSLNPKNPFQHLPPNHLLMNLSFMAQVLITLFVFNWLGILYTLPYLFGALYVALAVSHITGEVLAHGQSRESLPFEGIMKALMFRFYGIEGSKAEEKLQEQKMLEAQRLLSLKQRKGSLGLTSNIHEPELDYPPTKQD